jgi:hypothetical protein
MSIAKIDSQGIKVYAADIPSTPWADCTAAIAGIKAGDQIGCIQSIGDVSETRATTEYSCMTSDEATKSLGSITRAPFDIGLLFNPADTAGQAALKAAFSAKTNFIIGIEFNNADVSVGPTGASGTIYWFEAGVSGVATSMAKDEAVMYTATIEIMSIITECDMVPGTA